MTQPLPSPAPHLTAETHPAEAPPGWRLECPECSNLDGQHAPGCCGISIPRITSQDPAAVPPPAPIPVVTPVPGSRLDQLRGMLGPAEAALAEAETRLAAVKAGIMDELDAAYPGREAVDLAAAPGQKPRRMRYAIGAWYVKAETLRAKHADVWEELKTRKRGSWRLVPLDEKDGQP